MKEIEQQILEHKDEVKPAVKKTKSSGDDDSSYEENSSDAVSTADILADIDEDDDFEEFTPVEE
jgi:hypothetical protein